MAAIILIMLSSSVLAKPCVDALIPENSHFGIYRWYDQLKGKFEYYRQPGRVFSKSSEIQLFFDTLTPPELFAPPVNLAEAKVAQGWYYYNHRHHIAIDYMKKKYIQGQDPTFSVYSIADGRVIAKYYSSWGGNLIIIEHQFSNDWTFRSVYLHLRDGYTHDRQLAINRPIRNIGSREKWIRYKMYVDYTIPSKLSWGTEKQKIPLQIGQKVKKGKFIGYAGNTGPGGISHGLHEDGEVRNKRSYNVHLHFSLAVKHPGFTNKGWVLIDPYGIYNSNQQNCYNNGREGHYPSLFDNNIHHFKGT